MGRFNGIPGARSLRGSTSRWVIAGLLSLIVAGALLIVFRTLAGPWRDHDHGELPRDSRYAETAFSADGRHMAYVRHVSPNWHVMLDGQQGPAFSLIQQVRFLASGRLVYRASEKDTGKDVVMDDGTRTSQFDSIEGLTFTEDDLDYAVVGKTGDRWSIASSRGTLVANLPSQPGDVALSADRRRCAYSLLDSDRTFVVGPEGERFGPFDHAGNLSLAASSGAVRYVALTNGGWAIYENNTAVVRSVYQLRPIADAKGQLLGHIEDRIETSRVVFRNSPHDWYAGVLRPTVSADGKHLLYVARHESGREPSHTLIRDGQATGVDAELMSDPVFDATGTPCVVGQIGPSLVVFKGDRVRGIENARIASRLAISPNGRYLGVGVREGWLIKWKAFDTEAAVEWQAPHAGGTWTYVYASRTNPNGWEVEGRSGRLQYQGKMIEGVVSVRTDRPVLIASRPANVPLAIAFVSTNRTGPGRTTDTFLLNLEKSTATNLGALDDSFVAWSPSAGHVLIRGSSSPGLLVFDTANGTRFEPMAMFGGPGRFHSADTSTLQWRSPTSLQIRVDAPCDLLASRANPECRGAEAPNRAFVLTADLDKQFAEAQRLDVTSPPGARETADAYWGSVAKGDLTEAFDRLSSQARGRIGGQALVMLQSLAPLFREVSDRRTFKLRTFKLDGRSASSTVDISGPDFSSTPAGRAFGSDMFGWQFSAAFRPEKELVDSFVAIVRKHAPALRATAAPIATHTVRCEMTFEGDRWAMSEDCANLMPRR